MICCEKCFNDTYIKEFIFERRVKDTCDFCGTINTYSIETSALSSFFNSLLNYYHPSITKGRPFHEIIRTDWNIFNTSLLEQRHIKKILKAIFNNNLSYAQNYRYSAKQTLLCENWEKFNSEIKHKNRFFFNDTLPLTLLEKMLQYLEAPLKKGNSFFRARIEPTDSDFLPADMKKPPKNAVTGRANPKNISYFYLASNMDTALHEIRPFDQDKVVVAKFLAKKDFRVIDLRSISPFLFIKDDDYLQLSEHISFLKVLSDELSKPIHPNDKEIEYLPTQYLCGFIKSKGWDGVLYRSAIAKKGYNIVMFDDSFFSFDSLKKYKITNFEFLKYKI